MPPKRSRLVLPPKEYKLLCIKVHQRDGYKCQVPWCKTRKNLHCHHIVFRSHGGDDASYNLITMCNACHDALHNRYLVVLPLVDRQPIDADKGVRWIFVDNWYPGKNKKMRFTLHVHQQRNL